jgi:hypothetical protein
MEYGEEMKLILNPMLGRLISLVGSHDVDWPICMKLI